MGIFLNGHFPGPKRELAQPQPYPGYAEMMASWVNATWAPGNTTSGTSSAPGGGMEEDVPKPKRPTISPALRSAIDGLTFAHGVGHRDASPILAYRAWTIRNGRLGSVGVGTISWPTRRMMEAVCQRGGAALGPAGPPEHNAPHPACQCGVYGFATPASLAQVMDSAVLGRVALGGEVVVCADRQPSPIPGEGGDGITPILGFRAQCAYPSLLYLWDTTHEARDTLLADNRVNASTATTRNAAIRALADSYGVETAPLPDALLEQLAAERDAAAVYEKSMLSTRNAHAAQMAALNQIYSQGQQQGYGLGVYTSPPGMSINVPNNSTGGGNVVINGGTSTHDGSHPLLPNGGGPGQSYAGLHAGLPAGLVAARELPAELLGLVSATPQTTGLHDALTAMARLAGLVQ